ncbi:MAG: cupin domain-containing protein [Thermoplasmata archaeon]|nr:cupin domain-containing protein [Thermoplasmata archaeon]
MNLLELGDQLDRPWMQRIIAQINGSVLRVVRYYGVYPPHRHDGEQFVLVLEGEVDIEEEGKLIHLSQMDYHIIPAGKLHRPIAKKPSLVLVCWRENIKTELEK